MSFENAFLEMIEVERGFSDNPLDRGGPTNLGCTLKTLSFYLGRPATVDEIKALTIDKVRPLYRKLYWDAMRLDEFPDSLALLVFNQCVLRGVPKVTLTLQAALGVKADGAIGPNTIAAAKAMPQKQLSFSFLRESHSAYIRICQADPSQLVFLQGWSNRIFDLIAKVI